jgi:hypothetical protein
MSVYSGRQGTPRPIYGLSSSDASRNCGCPDGFNAVLSNLVLMLKATEEVVTKFFPAATAFAPIIACMEASVTTSPFIFVRLVWADQHRGVAFDKTRYKHVVDLIDIYYQFKLDPTTDPLPLFDLLAAATMNVRPSV